MEENDGFDLGWGDHEGAIQTLLDKYPHRLSVWGDEFLHSIGERLEDGHTLTEGQVDKLDGIWGRVTQ